MAVKLLSISSFNGDEQDLPLSRNDPMPDEMIAEPVKSDVEQAVVLQAASVAAILAILIMPLFTGYRAYLVNLQPSKYFSYWSALVSPEILYVVIAIGVVTIVWLASIRMGFMMRRGRFHRIPISALSALLILIVSGLLFDQSRFQWFFLEAAKVRSEQYSFLRSLEFWKRNEMDEIQEAGKRKLMFVGSSQVNLGIDNNYIEKNLDRTRVSKYVLPGFGIMQYLMAEPELIRMHPDAVICWLSEFDVFREDRIPANRLRAFSSFARSVDLIGLLQPHLVWLNRSELMDIVMGAVTPVWRDRDTVRRLMFHFWWPSTIIMVEVPKSKLLQEKKLEDHIESLKIHLHRTSLVEANFMAFSRFASLLNRQGVSLYVFEGSSNPKAMSVYDPNGNMRNETRERFEEMAEKIGFVYVRSSHMPVFEAKDFADAVHLKPIAKERFSEYLAHYLGNSMQQTKLDKYRD